MCQAQRAQVAGPSWLAMPRSSPAGQGGRGVLLRVSASSFHGSMESAGAAARQAASSNAARTACEAVMQTPWVERDIAAMLA
jgi:hypothetical protein